LKLLDNEELFETQIKQLRNEISDLKIVKRSKSCEEDNIKDEIQKQLSAYAEKIRSLEEKLQQREEELRDERIDSDQRAKEEINLIKEG